MAKLIAQVGACTLAPRRGVFITLCDAIVSQQLSPAAAATIFARFRALFRSRRPTPAAVRAIPLRTLRRAGLSMQKARYLKDLAGAFVSGRLDARRLAALSNEEVITRLVAVNGIGRWTAEMFLIFALNRLDVLPVDDLGIRKAVRDRYALGVLPAPRTLRRMAAVWRPYATIACWYLWRGMALRPGVTSGTAR
jgi:DNA-3-methyladenine glycosylase II